MTKKMMKIISTMLLMILILGLTATSTFANVEMSWNDVKLVGSGSETQNSIGTISGQIIGIVQVVGMAVAVIMLIVLAIKYISSAPNDKAEIKKHAVVYVVGAIVLFATSGILEIIKGFASQIH